MSKKEKIQSEQAQEPEVQQTQENREPESEISLEEAMENLSKAEKQLEDTVNELEQTKDSFKRTLAEYDNFRKRSAKEKSENFTIGKVEAIKSLLPILDTLEIALKAPCQDAEYKKGIEMVMNTAQNTLSNLGVEEIEAVGAVFDPNFHSAVLQQEMEGFESGTVTQLLQKGYKLSDKVIRVATVAVAP